MPALQRLVIHFQFELVDNVSLWSILAKAPAIPTLKELSLDTCIMNMDDFTTFIGKHCSTWTSLIISHVHLCKGTKEQLGDLYERLSQAPSIAFYRQRSLYFGMEHNERIGMPGQVCCVFLDDREDEDGFVEICQTDWVQCKGHDEAKRVLGLIAKHMRS